MKVMWPASCGQARGNAVHTCVGGALAYSKGATRSGRFERSIMP
jgi:hypothetical protein